MDEIKRINTTYSALREAVFAKRRQERLKDRQFGKITSAVLLTAVLIMCVSYYMLGSTEWAAPFIMMPGIMAMHGLIGPYYYAKSFRRISYETDDLLDPEMLSQDAPRLAPDLRRLAQLLKARTDDEIAQFVCLSGTVAQRLSKATAVDFAATLHRNPVMSKATPAKRARELVKAFEGLAVDVEGNLDSPATKRTFHIRTCDVVQLWRQCAEDMGVFIPEIVHQDDVPLRGGVTPLVIGSTDVLDVVAARLDDASVVERIRLQRKRHENADPTFFTDMDRVETTNMLERHLPRLASRFVTAHDTSTGGQRDEVRGVAVASLDMLTSALEDAMDRHAQAARDALQTERRFLEKKTVDPWTTAASSPD